VIIQKLTELKNAKEKAVQEMDFEKAKYLKQKIEFVG
jgi:excinuclease UvrABC nuclease subunit